MTQRHEQSANHRQRAECLLNNLGIWHLTLGQLTEALAPTQEAINIRRLLAVTDPDRHHTDLADSLILLADILSRLGRADEAVEASVEAAKYKARIFETE
jgi:tetratricopeptide (TPR) repeat protein